MPLTNVYPCFSQTAILDSPQFGYEEQRIVPAYLISDPSDVVAAKLFADRLELVHRFNDR
jgi:hypothetical protein